LADEWLLITLKRTLDLALRRVSGDQTQSAFTFLDASTTDMSDLDTGKTFQHLVIAAVAGAIIIFALKAGVDRALSAPKAKTTSVVSASSIQSTPATPQSGSAELEEAAHLEAVRLAAIAKQERLAKEKEQSAVDQAKREQKLQDALAARETAAAQARKDAAWQRFYKKPKKCDNPSDNSVIVDCSNHYLREEQRFEKLYSDGKS